VTVSSIRCELAAAVRAVNAAYGRLPRSIQDGVEIQYDRFEADVDAAIFAGDRDGAARAITAWREHWIGEFEKAGGGHA
jgi:hypothetical protein